MRKFIKGTFELDTNVTDLAAYEESHKPMLLDLFDWATEHETLVRVGVAEDGAYLMEYKIMGNTISYCKGVLKELKSKLKAEFPKVESLWQGQGNQLLG